MTARTRLVLTAAAIVLSSHAIAIGAADVPVSPKLYPVDEAARDPSFVAFRAQLRRAVRRHDTAFVLSILSPAITCSFGGDGGPQELIDTWHPEGRDSRLWVELGKVLAMGGTWQPDRSFVAPYVFSASPKGSDDFTAVIVGTGVRLRSEPRPNAPVIALLDHDIVRLPYREVSDSSASGRAWSRVVLADGREGYVAERYVRSVIDYRAGFERRDGRWLMTFFVAGD